MQLTNVLILSVGISFIGVSWAMRKNQARGWKAMAMGGLAFVILAVLGITGILKL